MDDKEDGGHQPASADAELAPESFCAPQFADDPQQLLLDELLAAKMSTTQPQIFVSEWDEEDDGPDEDVEEKDMSDPVEQFLTAAEEGDLERMERMLSANPALLMAQDRDKYTGLHRAAYSDKPKVCEWLLSKGASPEMKTGEGWTPLHCAANWANYEVVALLLRHGVDVNSRTEGQIVPLHLAINSSAHDPDRQYQTTQYLLEAPGIEMNAVNAAGDTPATLKMSPKRQKSSRSKSKPGTSDEESGGRSPKKARRVVIDESGEEDEGDEPKQMSNRDGGGGGNVAGEEDEGEEDKVVSEVPVYLLPLMSKSGSTTVSINRLQFPQQHPYLLRRRFGENNGTEEEEDQDHWDGGKKRKKCFAHYKAQVKHLRLGFGSPPPPDNPCGDGAIAMPATSSSSSGITFGGGGLAELLTSRSDKFTPSKQQQQMSAASSSQSSSSTTTSRKSGDDELVFSGEGFSQHSVLSHAVGFFSGGNLFLLPVDKTYEMRKPLTGSIEREAARAAQKVPAPSLKSPTTASTSVAAAATSSQNLAPLRVRFARPENDMQRRRREQSSLYKQKLVEQDQWIPLRVQHTKVAEIFAEEIGQAMTTQSSSSNNKNNA